MLTSEHIFTGPDAAIRARAYADAFLAAYHPAGYSSSASAFITPETGAVRLVLVRARSCD